MVPFINQLATEWYTIFMVATIQNSIFIGLILLLIYLFRDSDIRFLRILAIIGFIKLLIPPMIKIPVDTQPLVAGLNTITIAEMAISLDSISDNLFSYQSWILFIWIFISVLLLLIIGLRTWHLKKIFSHAKPVDISDISAHHLTKKIKFYKSNGNHSPVLMGLFHKKVIVPKEWDNWNDTCKSTVITHELNHVQNKDPWYNILRAALLALNFFNPLVWMLSKRLIILSEMVCDDVTVDYLKSTRASYSNQLIDLSAQTIHQKSDPAISLAFSESYRSMKNRISYQLSKKESDKMKKMSKSSIVLSVVIFATMLLFSWQCESNEMGSEINASNETNTAENKVFEYSEVTVTPEMIKKGLPEYPEEARKAGVTGNVVVTVTIDGNGNVQHAEIFETVSVNDGKESTIDKKSPAMVSLEQEALKAAKRCKFKPAQYQGKNVSVSLNIPYKFALK